MKPIKAFVGQEKYEMIRVITFAIFSAFFIYVSKKSLLSPQSHGFYRFFAWESILALVLLNALQWFKNPFSPQTAHFMDFSPCFDLPGGSRGAPPSGYRQTKSKPF
jgi:hypothetical protein